MSIVIYILLGIVVVVILLLALVGLDEVIQSRNLARWYEKRDRGQQIIKKLKSEKNK